MIILDHKVDHLRDIGIIVGLDHLGIETETEIGTEIENLDLEVDQEEEGK